MPVPPPSSSNLPPPDDAGRVHSATVAAAVRDAIARNGGWLSFERYMQLVLYAPGLGYYVAGARKFGAEGDFVTAPELSPLFGATLASAIAPALLSPEAEILELGAGSGALAASMLAALASRDRLPSRYRIVEVSPELRQRQRERIARELPALLDRVQWIDDLPRTVTGAIVLNEVLDAIPMHVIVNRDGRWCERGVVTDGAGFRWDERALDGGASGDGDRDRRLVALARERFPADIDYASEVNPSAEALVETLGRRLARGTILIADYGFERKAYYHPQRDEGTLMVHYRHRALADPFIWPGLADVTAHVDFTAMAEAGVRAGLEVKTYAAQARFLIDAGILDRLAALGPPQSVAYLRAASAVQTLLSPAEMGELVKVMVLERP